MTRPLRMRPGQRAGFETGAVSAIVDMTCSMMHGDACLKDERGERDPTAGRIIFLKFWPLARLAVAHQAVEMHADMGGFRRGVGERDGAVEGDAGLVVAAELHQERAAHAEEMKIIRQPRAPAARSSPAPPPAPRTLETATARLSVTTGDGCMSSSAP